MSATHPLKSTKKTPTHLCGLRLCVVVVSAPWTALFTVRKVGSETCALQATFKKNPGNTTELVVQMLLMWVLSTEESSSFGFSENIAEAAVVVQTELVESELAPPAGQEVPAAAAEPPSTNDEIRMPLRLTVSGRRSQSSHLPSIWITNGQKCIFNKSWWMDGRKCLEYSVAADAAFCQK